MYEHIEFLQATVPDEEFTAVPKYIGTVLTDIMYVRMHHRTGGNYPVGKEPEHVIKQFQHLVPVLGAD
jgi:hypothetical protein